MFSFKLTTTQWIIVLVIVFFILNRNNEHFDFTNFETIATGSSSNITSQHSSVTEDECKQWSATASKQYVGNNVLCLGPNDCPRFCYVSGGKVYWNNNKDGVCSQYQKCILKKV